MNKGKIVEVDNIGKYLIRQATNDPQSNKGIIALLGFCYLEDRCEIKKYWAFGNSIIVETSKGNFELR
jgi:hypothetical protein